MEIFQENGLFGAKENGIIIIPPQYMEMQPFSCGLSLVRNHQYQYAYINYKNKQIVPFGKYSWCDPQFTCGFSRVMEYHYLEEKNKWGIINTLGNIVVPIRYDRIWTIREEYIFSTKAFIGNKEQILNLHQLANNIILDGLTYINTYSVETFKQITNCSKLFVKRFSDTSQMYFTYGCNIGLTALTEIPKEPVIAIVANSNGKIFPLLMEKADVGKTTLTISTTVTNKKIISKTSLHKASFLNYEEEKINDADNWSDPYGYEQAYYGGWHRDDIENGLADAYECDLDTRLNND
ncbi:MAG TPA: hypothetical protein DD383_05595 [Rikenellaceae bacterium]|nr:hypothetical protein [Rikenellaceae bacterium]